MKAGLLSKRSLGNFALTAVSLACLGADAKGARVPALEDGAWQSSEWISAKDASGMIF